LSQKNKELKEKDKKIVLLENKVKTLNKENTLLKEKSKKSNNTDLNRALERIHELESK
jgi:hypothetical protein